MIVGVYSLEAVTAGALILDHSMAIAECSSGQDAGSPDIAFAGQAPPSESSSSIELAIEPVIFPQILVYFSCDSVY